VASLFVDTSAFYALADSGDRHRDEALATFQDCVTSDDLTTTDHVIVESWLLICTRLGRPAAMRFWDALRSEIVAVTGVTAQDFWRGHAIARAWPDQMFSLVDCTSFAVIERLGIRRAFAFDAHFRIFRLGPWPRQALEIVPY
jgi:uncharacterized protein